MENSNLPIKVNNSFALSIENKRQLKRFQEGLKKVGKITMNGVAATAAIIAGILGRSYYFLDRCRCICSIGI